jgi:hypothetical protein
MPRKEPLYDLVQALTKAEKRRFRLQAERYGAKDGEHGYLHLFRLLEKMSAYDPASLESAFGSKQKLAVAKRNLMETLLSALLAHEKSDRAIERIGLLIRQADLFAEKRIYYRAATLYERALAMAREQHRYTLVIEALARMKGLLGRWKAGGEQDERMYAVLDEMLVYSGFQLDWSRLMRLHARLHAEIVRWRKGGKGLDDPLVLEELNSEWYEDVQHSRNSLIRMLRMHIESEHQSVFGKPPEAYAAMRQAVALCEEERAWQAENPGWYVAMLNNLVGRALVALDFDEVRTTLARLKAFSTDDPVAQDRHWESLSLNRLIMAVFDGEDLSPEDRQPIEEWLGHSGINRAFKLAIQLELAILDHFAGRKKASGYWLQRFWQDPAHTKLRQQHLFSRLLSYLQWLEEDELEVLKHRLEQHQKEARKSGYLLDVGRLVVEHLLAYVGAVPSERPKHLDALLEALKPLRASEGYHIYLDVDACIEAMRQGVSVLAIRAQRVQHQSTT